MARGSVLSLQRWPVKSMAGERVDALSVDEHGAVGDRAHAVFAQLNGRRRRLNAEGVPRLLAWAAAYPDVDDAGLTRDGLPQPAITAPDGTTLSWDDPELATALGDDLCRDVTLVRETRGQQDRPGTLHVTVERSLRRLEEELGAPIDARRFRSNLHVDLDADASAEDSWLGRRLRIGDAELEIVEGCERCAIPTRDPDTQEKWAELLRWLAAERATMFGVIVRAAVPAIVRRGDEVRLV